MQAPALRLLTLISTGLLLAACSGGGAGTSATLKTRCAPSAPSKFCLASCNLGCSSVGCNVTEIAQNQKVTLTFSQPIDPASVNAGSVSIKTAGGEPPAGSMLIAGDTLTFQPEVTVIGGSTTFGFRANEVYVLALPGGLNEDQALRSISGDRLGEPVQCTLSVSRGVIDPDGLPPTAKLIGPPGSSNNWLRSPDTKPVMSSWSSDDFAVNVRAK